ncbi:MAG: PEP-utilizing enzyme, partial [Dehalococcoidia bacterium]
IYTTFLSSVPVGALTQICAALGRESDALKIMSGVGDVPSAAPSVAMWKLGRLVARDPGLTAAFDAGVEGLVERLPECGDPGRSFLREFDAFLYEFGCRGPNEWEPRRHTWETRPELALALIDRMRLAGEDADPELHQREMAATRERLVAEISEALRDDPETQGTFLAAARAATVFQAGRERTKTNAVRLGQEARMALHTMGRRRVAAGECDEVDDFAFVLADEVDGWITDAAPLRETIRQRRALYEEYLGLQEPFVFSGEIPDPSTWPLRSGPDSTPVQAGEVLTGFPGCSGTATGIARVVLDPLDPTALEPGDILVAPITDPSWTPLFVSAAGVIVDVGAQQSHAMIVSRELGIPCVPSVTGATRRIPDGATVTVDGDSGTVTVVALPGAAGRD